MRCVFAGVLLLCCISAQTKPDPKYVPVAEQIFNAPTDVARLLAANQALATPELVKTMSELAGQVLDQRDYQHSLAMYQTVCVVARALGDRFGEAKCTFNSGMSHARLYDREDALALYDQAISMFRELNKPIELANALNSIGVTLRGMGDLNSALTYMQKALEAANLSGDPIVIAQSNFNFGTLYNTLGRYGEAIQSYQKALDLIRNRPGLDRRMAMILNNMGFVYFNQHEMDLAIDLHEQSRALKEKINAAPAELATSVVNLGLDYEYAGQYDKATAYYDRAARLAGNDLQTRVLVTSSYGMMLHKLGRAADAIKKLNEAIELTDRLTDEDTAAFCRIELAEIAVDQGRNEEALALAQSAAGYGRRENSPLALMRANEVRSSALIALDRREEAQSVLLESIRAGEAMRSSLPGERQNVAKFREGQSRSFERMIILQLMNHRPDLALAYSERFKGQALLEILRSSGTQVTKTLTPEERREEAAKSAAIRRIEEQMIEESRRPTPDRKRLAAYGKDLEQARIQHRVFEMSLYAAHPELRVQRVDFEPASAVDLASALPDNETGLLEYSISDLGIHLFAVTRGPNGPEVKAYDIPIKRAALARDVKQFRQQLASRDLDYRKLASSLYQQLIQPAAPQIRGKRTLVIVPEGPLWQLPFQALESSAGRYLVEDHAVFYTPSLSVLHEMEKVHLTRNVGQPRLLAMEAAAVPAAQREADGLRRLYGTANVKVYAGGEADNDHLKSDAPNYQILHLAAHGVFEDQHPMESYLVLAKAGRPEAGVLAARDMMDLNLHADMVVLSGCETGRSSDNGAGLIGMSWALFIAGAPSTVASQWKVDSESTSALMLEFHRNLRTSSKVKAMQQAQMAVMKNPEYRHPFYWSGFILMGEGF